MNDKPKYNPNIHHRRSIRKKGYDYSQEGLYFITICVQDRLCLFGEIREGKMVLNEVGKIANECWMEIPKHFPHVVLHEHIVMPNHVHGIVEIIRESDELPGIVGPSHGMSQQPNINKFGNPIPGSISVVINQYKSSVKRWCNKNGHPYFRWQSRFHDHIIRNEQSYCAISEYIINNPLKW